MNGPFVQGAPDWITIRIEDAAGVGIESIVYNDVNLSLQLAKAGLVASAKTLASAAEWVEQANGYYWVRLTATDLNTVGAASLIVIYNAVEMMAVPFRVYVDSVDSVDGFFTAAVVAIKGSGSKDITQIDTKLGTPAGVSISADIAAVKTDSAAIKLKTDNLPASPAATGAAMTLTSGERLTVADAIWDEARSGHVTAGSFGQGVASVQGAVTGAVATVTALAANSVNASALATDAVTEINAAIVAGTVGTNVAAIKTKTDNLPIDPADQSIIIAATDAIYGRIGAPIGVSISADIETNLTVSTIQANDIQAKIGLPTGASLSADVAAVKADTAAVKAKTDSLPTDPADQSLVIAATDAIYTRVGAPVGVSVSADIAAIKAETVAVKAKTDNLPASPAATGAAMTLTAGEHLAIADATWDEARAGHVTAGSFGEGVASIQGNVTGSVATVTALAANSVNASALATDAVTEINAAIVAGTVGTNVAAIKAKTDNVPTDPADASVIDAAITAAVASIKGIGVVDLTSIDTKLGVPAGASVSADIAAINLNTTGLALEASVQAVKAKTDNLPVDPASQTNLDVAVSTRLATAGYTAPDNTTIGTISTRIGAPTGVSVSADVAAVKTDTTAIKVSTDALPVDPADASVVAAAITAAVTSIMGAGGIDLTAVDTKLGTPVGVSVSADIAAIDLNTTGLALETSVQGVKAKTDTLPADPASQTNLDVAISTRLATAGYTAPDNTTINTVNTRIGAPTGASLSADVAAVKAETATIKTETTSLLVNTLLLLGLNDHRTVRDTLVYDITTPTDLVSARIRSYDSAVNAVAAGATGLLATWNATYEYSAPNVLSKVTVVDL